jgi:hypothetical protein
MWQSSIQVTMRVYKHLLPSGNREWVGKSVTSSQLLSRWDYVVAVPRIERGTRGL